jgi:hypothetical protein
VIERGAAVMTALRRRGDPGRMLFPEIYMAWL